MQIIDLSERIKKIEKSECPTIINITTGEEIHTNDRDCMKLYEKLCANGGNFTLVLPITDWDKKSIRRYRNSLINHKKSR
ncbi:MAG: hypothetical protein ACI4N3_02640 [Alphaproteobacteria bacterium]